MLLAREALAKIEIGEVDLVFRRWKRPTVKSGGQLRTPAGVLEIRSVRQVDLGELEDSDARRAGFDSLESLRSSLQSRDSGDVYRVEVGRLLPDPRVELRARAYFDEGEIDALSEQLNAHDRRAKSGPWTRAYLRLIADNPNTLAETLASTVDVEKQVFKRRVRKLKELGLTISKSPGYQLSPRGEELIRLLGI